MCFHKTTFHFIDIKILKSTRILILKEFEIVQEISKRLQIELTLL